MVREQELAQFLMCGVQEVFTTSTIVNIPYVLITSQTMYVEHLT